MIIDFGLLACCSLCKQFRTHSFYLSPFPALSSLPLSRSPALQKEKQKEPNNDNAPE